MSCNRENIIWKSPDGTWNLGFYEFYVWGEDHEWDVTYHYDVFGWLSRGYASMERARGSWNGANPGAWYTETDAERVTELEEMASAFTRSGRNGWF